MTTNLYENVPSLTTPDFAGTTEEITTALSFWTQLSTQILQAANAPMSYENKKSILDGVQSLISDVTKIHDNVTAVQTTDQIPTMSQTPAPEQTVEPAVVDLAAQETVKPNTRFSDNAISKLQKLAGVSYNDRD